MVLDTTITPELKKECARNLCALSKMRARADATPDDRISLVVGTNDGESGAQHLPKISKKTVGAETLEVVDSAEGVTIETIPLAVNF